MACKCDENQVVIRELETGEQTEFELVSPFKCAASMNYLAVTSAYRGLRLFTLDGDLVSIVPKSSSVTCAAFHPHNTNILAIGFADRSVRMRDVRTQARLSSFQKHTKRISSIRIATDGRLFLSSHEQGFDCYS